LPAGEVIIDFDGVRWVAVRGDTVTVGRSRACQIRLPQDDHLSRRAVSLRVLEDCLVIRNESGSKPLVLRPPMGEDRVVEPGAATASLPFQRFHLVLAGSGGRAVAIGVDAAGLRPEENGVDPSTRAPQTAAEPVLLSGAQRRVLVSLCAPMLVESGSKAVPATYAQIGRRLGRSPRYIRNVVKSLREKLSGYGVASLVREDDAVPDEGAQDDFRWELARWAIRSRLVCAADVDGSDDRS
jgi:hypothetical protein